MHLNRFAIIRINEMNVSVCFKQFVSWFVGYESPRALGTNWSKVGTKRLSLGTNRVGTKDPWVRNDWIPLYAWVQIPFRPEFFSGLSCVCNCDDQFYKLTSVFYASVLLLIINFVMTDPRGDSRVDPQTTLTMLWRNSLSITGETH